MRITWEDAVLNLKKAVEDYGADWVDPYVDSNTETCQYNYEINGEPKHCIVGYVMAELNIEVPSWDNTSPFMNLVESNPYSFIDRDVFNLLYFAQRAQDSGRSWGQITEVLLSYPREKYDQPTNNLRLRIDSDTGTLSLMELTCS